MTKTDKWYGAAAFFLPVLPLLIAFAVGGIFPFGGKTILSSDLKEQYFDIAVVFFNKIKNGGNIFVLNETRTGLNLYVFAAFLLFSPFNILFLFFDYTAYPYIFELVYILKIGFSGLCAYIFFKKSRNISLHPALCTAFSIMYAVSSFNIVCSINIMWLDSVILLPLCWLCTEHLVENGKWLPFSLVYFLCAVTCYYHAYIAGLLCFLYLLYYCLINKRPVVKNILRLVLAAAFAIMLAGFVIVPAVEGLFAGYEQKVQVVSDDSILRFGLNDVLKGLFFVEDGSPVINGTLNICFGILPLFMLCLLLVSKKTDKREKILTAGMTVFFMLAFMLRPLYVFMHFLREPTSFDGRFIYGMTLMFMVFAARAFMICEKPKGRETAAALIIMGVCLFIGAGTSPHYLKYAAAVLVLLCVYAAVVRLENKKPALLLVIVCAETTVSASLGMAFLDKYLAHSPKNEYTDNIRHLSRIAENIEDDGFYRTTDLYAQGRMTHLGAGLAALDCFSSTLNQRASGFMKRMGIRVISDDKYISSIDNTIVNESIFGVKYVLVTDKTAKIETADKKEIYYPNGARLLSPFYRKIYEDDTDVIYKNTTALPLMFACGADINDTEFYDEEVISGFFINNNRFLNKAAGTDKDMFEYFYDIGEPYAYNCTLENEDVYSTINLLNNESGSAVYDFVCEKDGEYFVHFYMENGTLAETAGSYVLSVNGAAVDHEFLKNSFAKDIGYFKAGDKIEIAVTAYKDGVTFTEPCIISLDDKAFADAVGIIQKNGLEDIRVNNDDITAKSNFKEDRFIFTTLGYDSGYRVYIDGKRTKTMPACGAMLGFYLPSGAHDIRVGYVSPGFEAGRTLSLLTAAALVIYIAIKKAAFKRP